jgi:hypothetical protein
VCGALAGRAWCVACGRGAGAAWSAGPRILEGCCGVGEVTNSGRQREPWGTSRILDGRTGWLGFIVPRNCFGITAPPRPTGSGAHHHGRKLKSFLAQIISMREIDDAAGEPLGWPGLNE